MMTSLLSRSLDRARQAVAHAKQASDIAKIGVGRAQAER